MRLLTRSDFDGICCAVLLKELGLMDEMVYAHPKDLQDGKIAVTKNDILTNVPYVPGCGLWFDHHSSEKERTRLEGHYEGRSAQAPSAAIAPPTRGRSVASPRGRRSSSAPS